MDTPASHFRARPGQERAVLPLWTPPELAAVPDGDPDPNDELEPVHDIDPAAAALDDPTPVSAPAPHADPTPAAVEIERIVPASGNLGICGQQFWLGTSAPGGPSRSGSTPAPSTSPSTGCTSRPCRRG